MPRPLPILPARRLARMHLKAGGGHRLELDLPFGNPVLDRDDVAWVEQAIAAWKRELTFEDGGPERLRDASKVLEV